MILMKHTATWRDKKKKIMKIKRSLTTCALESLSPVHWKVQVEPQFRLCRRERDISGKGTASPAQRSKKYSIRSFFTLGPTQTKKENVPKCYFTWWFVKAVLDFLFFLGGCLFAKFSWARSISEKSSFVSICKLYFPLHFAFMCVIILRLLAVI